MELCDSLDEELERELGYKIDLDEMYDIHRQNKRINANCKLKNIHFRRISVARNRLQKYYEQVNTVFNNGFKGLDEDKQELIVDQVLRKTHDIAFSTGLNNAKAQELAEDYMLKIKHIYDTIPDLVR